MSPAQHDPRGKVRLALQPGVTGAAIFSSCGQYRRVLSRSWDDGDESPFALWLGMNPSTAEANCDDPTVRREIGFTRRLGLRAYAKMNIADYRATYPDDLLLPGVVPRSPDNLAAIVACAARASKVVAAWGALKGVMAGFAFETASALIDAGTPLWCVGVTQSGAPRHPLYVSGKTELVRWYP